MNISFRALDLTSKLSNCLPRKISSFTQVMFFSMYVRHTYVRHTYYLSVLYIYYAYRLLFMIFFLCVYFSTAHTCCMRHSERIKRHRTITTGAKKLHRHVCNVNDWRQRCLKDKTGMLIATCWGLCLLPSHRKPLWAGGAPMLNTSNCTTFLHTSIKSPQTHKIMSEWGTQW